MSLLYSPLQFMTQKLSDLLNGTSEKIANA